jgi:hypothetical protein
MLLFILPMAVGALVMALCILPVRVGHIELIPSVPADDSWALAAALPVLLTGTGFFVLLNRLASSEPEQ